MLTYFKTKRYCREYAKTLFRDSEALCAYYSIGESHTFSKEFQLKLNTAVYGEPFTDAEIEAYLHPAPSPTEAAKPQKIRIRKLGMRYAAAVIAAAVLTTGMLVGLGGVVADPQGCNDVRFGYQKSGCSGSMEARFPFPAECYNSIDFNGYTAPGFPDHVSAFDIGNIPEGFALAYEKTESISFEEIELNNNWDEVSSVRRCYEQEGVGWLNIDVQIAHTSRLWFSTLPKNDEGVSRVFTYRGNDAFILARKDKKSVYCTMIWCDGLNDYYVCYVDTSNKMTFDSIQDVVISVANSVHISQK